MSALLVNRHQTRIADDISRKDRRQSPFDTQRLGRAVDAARPKTPPRQGHLGRDPLDSERRAAREQSSDPGLAYVRPKFFQHDPASFDRRDPPGTIGQKRERPRPCPGGPGNRLHAQTTQRRQTSSGPRRGCKQHEFPTSKFAPFRSWPRLYARLGAASSRDLTKFIEQRFCFL